MQVIGSYGVRIRDDYDALKRTAGLFSDAVSHLVHTALSNWNNLSDTDSSFARLRMMECIIHSSDGFVSPDIEEPLLCRRLALSLPISQP